jgi:tRNA threonylcarbamoyladenosine biosynthesis protein TsaB
MTGDALAAFADEMRTLTSPPQASSVQAGAAAIAACALPRWLAGQTIEPALAAPLYVRDHVALTIEERRAPRRQTV